MDNECIWLFVNAAGKGNLEPLEEIWEMKNLLNSEVYSASLVLMTSVNDYILKNSP